MKRLLILAGMLLALVAPAALTTLAVATPASAAPTGVEATVEQSRVSTTIGDRLTVRVRFANTGGSTTERLIADLGVVSLSGVYVDLEDWSAARSQELAPLPPGASASLSWDLQAMNAGSFDVYVVAVPAEPASASTGPAIVSPPVHVTVAGRRTLNAGGALPVAVAVPVLLGLAMAAARYRVRRRTG